MVVSHFGGNRTYNRPRSPLQAKPYFPACPSKSRGPFHREGSVSSAVTHSGGYPPPVFVHVFLSRDSHVFSNRLHVVTLAGRDEWPACRFFSQHHIVQFKNDNESCASRRLMSIIIALAKGFEGFNQKLIFCPCRQHADILTRNGS